MSFTCSHIEPGMHRYKLNKIRENVLETMYNKSFTRPEKKGHDNPRLRLRFKEAIKEAHEICANTKNSYECHIAWYEVDELEDSLMRQDLKDYE
jgi:hypothetical protein